MAFSIGSDDPAMGASAENDPFVGNHSSANPLRYSNYDSNMFALGPGTSAEQAKRALEAHLAETERRMAEAGKLGTALVQQQQELTERLREVEQLEAEGELTSDLKQRLVEIEKDYNEVARESARAFLPKQRIPSNESTGSPYVPEGKGGRRSVSPSKFESQATGSPTKLSVPNRKIRNQPVNRVHDIEFATEISTSLIAQVRNLQALLAEREEELRDIKVEKSRIEIDHEGLQQRNRTLDESEHRYKDENWNLETQIHELLAAQKDAADREKKLTQTVTALQVEKNSAQKELDEIKVTHSKLVDEHAAVVKHHDIELGTAKRNAVMAESERGAMQRKIDELTGQNSELAKAFSMSRGRALERESAMGMSDEDFETANDNVTPEHSPPPSPVKGTPRHSMLESETLKTSLHHAQRTIQSLRTNVHREKTEKLELKRMLQDARDELEKMRGDPSASNRRSRKMDSREFKKPLRSSQLGGARSSRTDLYMDDPNWEEQGEGSPSLSPGLRNMASRESGDLKVVDESSDHFDTAHETSDAAFETAHERGTETEDFHTGAEEFSDEDVATETESPSRSRGAGRIKRPPSLPLNTASNRYSYHSTASTSNDEDDYMEASDLRTPVASSGPQKMRLRVSRGALSRRSRQVSEEPTFQSSPASFANSSTAGTPQQPAQSLFAELGDLDGSEDESLGANTPSRTRSGTPGSGRARMGTPPPLPPPVPKLIMVDSGVMTDPVEIVSPSTLSERPMSMDSVVGPSGTWLAAPGSDDEASRRLSTFSYSDAGNQYDQDLDEKLRLFPSPPTSPPKQIPALPPVSLSLSTLQAQDIEPRSEPEPELVAPPSLKVSHIASESVEPVAEPGVPLPPVPTLSLSSIQGEDIEPKAEPERRAPPRPTLSYSGVSGQYVEPVPEPKPSPVVLSFSDIQTEGIEPVAEPERVAERIVEVPVERVVERIVEVKVKPTPPTLALANIQGQQLEPVELVEPPSPELPVAVPVVAKVLPSPVRLSFANIENQQVEPVQELAAPHPVLAFTNIQGQQIEPVAEPKAAPAPLAFTDIQMQQVEPIAVPKIETAPLSFAGIQGQHIEPVALPPAALSFTSIQGQNVEPVAEPKAILPPLSLSTIASEGVEPIKPATPVRQRLGFTALSSLGTEPIPPRSPKRNAIFVPRDEEREVSDQPRTPTSGLFGSVLGWKGKGKTPSTPITAEDETRQSPSDTPLTETPESQRPFKERSANSNAKPVRKQAVATTDASAQTSLTSDAIDQVFKAKAQAAETQGHMGHHRMESLGSSMGTPGTVRHHRRTSQDSVSSVIRRPEAGEASAFRRPGSAASTRASIQGAPPLPPNHKEVIEAARTGSSHGGHGTISSMGPPILPASAYRNNNVRPRTPSGSKPMLPGSPQGTPTPRAGRFGTAEIQSPTRISARSRQSSVSSFASEVDARFNMQAGMGTDPSGFGPNTDPRMIQAITQTMIGEFLWKYTRKAGRGDMSENRHRRYFWVHPYTRTLYWSDRDPSTAGRSELKAKSVPIEAVRVVTDDNPMPPGLHRKSLVIISPGRTVKFTCTTGQRHETWFNALSYLLLRTNNNGQKDTEEMAENITQEDVDEFNPQFGRRPTMGTRPRPPPSLASYRSRTSRTGTMSPVPNMSVPTLTPTTHRTGTQSAQRPSMGTLGRISGYWRSSSKLSGTFSSLRSRSQSSHRRRTQEDVYEADAAHDSAEDLRMIYEQQDRESDRLENVRACCDGKHDVGTLHKRMRGGHSHSHHHSHPSNGSGTSTPAPAPSASVNSRA